MTLVRRVCRRPFADLSGEGARLYGGRWNSPGRPLVCAAETAALPVLEVRVHLDLDWDVLPDDDVPMAIDLGQGQGGDEQVVVRLLRHPAISGADGAGLTTWLMMFVSSR